MKFEFTEDQINYILNVIAERPYKESAPMVAEIQRQAQGQLQLVHNEEEAEAG